MALKRVRVSIVLVANVLLELDVPAALDCVGVGAITSFVGHRVIDSRMPVTFGQIRDSAIAFPTVAEDDTPRCNVLLDQWKQCIRRTVFDGQSKKRPA